MKKISLIAFICVLTLTACGSQAGFAGESESETYEDIEATDAAFTEPWTIEEDYSDMDLYAYWDLVPPLREGASEMIGPWAYIFYAKDEGTSYIYHDASDGYVPKAGDLIITGDEDYDELYIDDWDLDTITGLGRFMYWHEDYAYNGHILYVASSDSGVLTCYEGNDIAPGQELDIYDPDYIYESSVDKVQIDFFSGMTLTADKPQEKQIRAVIETGYDDAFVWNINKNAAEMLEWFEEDPETVRYEVMSLYPFEDIDWCGLFVHYVLIRTVSNGELP